MNKVVVMSPELNWFSRDDFSCLSASLAQSNIVLMV